MHMRHSVHLFWSMKALFSIIDMAWTGHIEMQRPQPLHFSISIDTDIANLKFSPTDWKLDFASGRQLL